MRRLIAVMIVLAGLTGCAQDVFYSKEYVIYRHAYDRGWYDSRLNQDYLFSNKARGGEDIKAARQQALEIIRLYNRRIK